LQVTALLHSTITGVQNSFNAVDWGPFQGAETSVESFGNEFLDPYSEQPGCLGVASWYAGSFQSGHKDSWDSGGAWEVLRSELGGNQMSADAPIFKPVKKTTGDVPNAVSLPSDHGTFAMLPSVGTWLTHCPLLSRAPSPSNQAQIVSKLTQAQEKIFADLFATMRNKSFATDLSLVLLGGSAGADILAMEQKIANALETTSSCKELSGEPWRAFNDIGELQTAARHFSTVARALPNWELDLLGRALNLRDIIASGREMPLFDHVSVQKLNASLSASALSVDEHTLTHAAYFYMEIGHFAGR
jgi:hypothetical protein